MNAELPDGAITVGRITGVYGVKGWVRVYSFTDPRDNIIGYRRWLVRRPSGWQFYDLVEGRAQGKGVVAALADVQSREDARDLMGSDIAVYRDELPAAEDGTFYWADLEGLQVYAGERHLGQLSHLVETGANDVMVVKGERERLIPFVMGVHVLRVDLEAGVIEVDWDPDF